MMFCLVVSTASTGSTNRKAPQEGDTGATFHRFDLWEIPREQWAGAYPACHTIYILPGKFHVPYLKPSVSLLRVVPIWDWCTSLSVLVTAAVSKSESVHLHLRPLYLTPTFPSFYRFPYHPFLYLPSFSMTKSFS